MAVGEAPHWRNSSNSQRPVCMLGYLDKNYLYGVHVTLDAKAIAYRYNMTTGAIQTIPLESIVSNVIDVPIYFPDDAHYGILTAVDKLDHVHIIGNSQIGNSPPGRPGSPDSRMHHAVCTNVNAFTNPASWIQGDEPGAAEDSSPDGGTYTYHNVDRLSNGDLVWFHSQVESRVSNTGRDNLFYRTNGGSTFAGNGLGNAGNGVMYSCNGSPAGVDDFWYLTGMLVQPDGGGPGIDRLHATGLLRPDWSDYLSETTPLYIYSDGPNHNVWKAGDGTTMTMPLTIGNQGPAVIPGATGTGVAGWGYILTTGTGAIQLSYKIGGVYTEFTCTNGVWSNSPMPAISGDEVRKWVVTMPSGTKAAWYSSVGGVSQRCLLTRSNLSQSVYVGKSIYYGFQPGAVYVSSYGLGPDPITYREQGYLLFNIGEGDTPLIWRFPDSRAYRGK